MSREKAKDNFDFVDILRASKKKEKVSAKRMMRSCVAVMAAFRMWVR